MHAPFRNLRKRFNFADAIIPARRIGINGQRIPGRTKPSRKLSVALFDEIGNIVLQLWPHGNERRKRITSSPKLRPNRSHMKPVYVFDE